jgi:hypothetical protein
MLEHVGEDDHVERLAAKLVGPVGSPEVADDRAVDAPRAGYIDPAGVGVDRGDVTPVRRLQVRGNDRRSGAEVQDPGPTLDRVAVDRRGGIVRRLRIEVVLVGGVELRHRRSPPS